MTLLQALAYFAREAALNLFRGWKVSLLAVLTIAVSLFLGGVFLLVGGNLRQMAERWQGESKVVVYLEAEAGAEAGTRLRRQLEEAPWTLGVELISAEAAQERFRETFPSMADLLTGWGERAAPGIARSRSRLERPRRRRGARTLAAGAAPPIPRCRWSTTIATGWASCARSCW